MTASGLGFDFILCEIILYIFTPSILFTTAVFSGRRSFCIAFT